MATATVEENPLLEGLTLRRRPDPCILVIFGASGDLTSRKLMPALYSLAYRRLLPEKFAVIGTSPPEFAVSEDDFRKHARSACDEFGTDPRKTGLDEYGVITPESARYGRNDVRATYSLYKRLCAEYALYGFATFDNEFDLAR